MRKVGIEPFLYAQIAQLTIASVYVGLNRFHLVDHIIQDMVSMGNNRTLVTSNTISSVYLRNEQFKADRVWEDMRKVGVEPISYAQIAQPIIASVYVGLDRFHLVDYIVEDMVSTGNNPTLVIFNAITSICLRIGLGGVDVAYEWFQSMKSMSIDPNDITYEYVD